MANTIRTIFNYPAYYFNLTKYLPFHIAGVTFLPKSKVNSLSGLIVGVFADYGVAIFLGIVARIIVLFNFRISIIN